MQISMIVAMAANRAIGRDNRMPWHLPADLKHFKETTMGCPVVMGRKTFDSILATLGRPLPGRVNIVVTRNPAFRHEGVLAAASPDDALKKAEERLSPTVSETFVIGGAELYRALLPSAGRLVITEIRQDFEGDAFFPALDPQLWREVSRRPQPRSDTSGGTPAVDFDFVEYRRR